MLYPTEVLLGMLLFLGINRIKFIEATTLADKLKCLCIDNVIVFTIIESLVCD